MTKTWEKNKAAIVALYKAENRPLHEVQAIMRDKFNFEASIRAYRTRFGKWGLQKYNARRRHSVATYLAGPRFDRASPSSPRSPGTATSLSQANNARNMSMPAINLFNQSSNYLLPSPSEMSSPPIKLEHAYRSAQSDFSDDSSSHYATSYGSEPGLYYVGSSQCSYSPRSVAFPSPQITYGDASIAMYDAIRHDDEAILSQILASCPQTAASPLTGHGATPMHVAVSHRSLAVLPQLLLTPGYPNMQDFNGDTPIHCLFRETGWWREEKLLVMAQELLVKTDVNSRNHAGESPFDVALAQFQSFDLRTAATPRGPLGLPTHPQLRIELLPGADGRFALDTVMSAVVDRLVGSRTRYSPVRPEGWRRAAEWLCALLAAGARADSPLDGLPILSYLLSRPAAETEAFGRLYDFTLRLVELADPAAPDAHQMTALDYAISARPQEGAAAQQRRVIQRLAERCGPRHLGMRGPDGRTAVNRAGTAPSSLVAYAMHWSAEEGFLETSMRLVEAGADMRSLIRLARPDSFAQRLARLASGIRADGGGGDTSLEGLQSAVAQGVSLGAAIWILACGQDSWPAARECLWALEKCTPTPPFLTQSHRDEAWRLLSTRFLDTWAQKLRAAASLPLASSESKIVHLAQDYMTVLALCAARGQHMRPDQRYYDLADSLSFLSPATDEYHTACVRI